MIALPLTVVFAILSWGLFVTVAAFDPGTTQTMVFILYGLYGFAMAVTLWVLHEAVSLAMAKDADFA